MEMGERLVRVGDAQLPDCSFYRAHDRPCGLSPGYWHCRREALILACALILTRPGCRAGECESAAWRVAGESDGGQRSGPIWPHGT